MNIFNVRKVSTIIPNHINFERKLNYFTHFNYWKIKPTTFAGNYFEIKCFHLRLSFSVCLFYSVDFANSRNDVFVEHETTITK